MWVAEGQGAGMIATMDNAFSVSLPLLFQQLFNNKTYQTGVGMPYQYAGKQNQGMDDGCF